MVPGRLLLVIVFAVAGVAKLADFAGSRKSMIDFGVPRSFAGALGILLPLAELAAALALIPGRTAWWGAAGAFGLLLLFIAGISFNLARGRKPDCHCFGQLHSAPAGWKTLARNIVLAAVAAYVLLPGPAYAQPVIWHNLAGLSGWQQLLLGGVAAILATLAVNLWLVAGVLRQSGRLLVRIEALEAKLGVGEAAPAPMGLEPGSPAPEFSLGGLDGKEVSLANLRAAKKPVLLIFIEPGCGPCDDLMPEASGWQTRHAEMLTVAVISRGDLKANRAKKNKYALSGMLLQKDGEVATAYECPGTPGAVLVSADGTIGSHLAMGADSIRSLVQHATMPPASKIGDSAPRIRLPDLFGKSVDLESFRGAPVIVLFWNPGCGFCQEALEGIKDWERRNTGDGLKLLVVSTGSVEDNRAQGFLSTVVLEQGFVAGYAFGAGGTPSAVLVDEKGKIRSDVAAGSVEVLKLIKALKVER